MVTTRSSSIYKNYDLKFDCITYDAIKCLHQLTGDHKQAAQVTIYENLLFVNHLC